MITTTEDHLITEVKDLFQGKLRTVESLPGDWDAEMLKRLIISAPAVYLAFTGGARKSETTIVGIDGRWSFFVITGHASGQAARRRGDMTQIGAYEILSRLIPFLDGHQVPEVGTLEVVRIENLYSGTIDQRGVALYAVLCNLPMYFDGETPVAALDNFETLHYGVDLAPADGNLEGEADIQLPQE